MTEFGKVLVNDNELLIFVVSPTILHDESCFTMEKAVSFHRLTENGFWLDIERK